MRQKIAVFLFDGFSDWEIAYLTPEINKSERFDLVYFSESGDAVTSMGGLVIQPTTSLPALAAEEITLLILPGGTAWESGTVTGMDDLTKSQYEQGKPIAAICAATTYLGRLDLLNELKHTSNDPQYLKSIAPQYAGEQHYQHSLAVTDRNVITANGIAPIEFAREIFKIIGLYDDEQIEKWYQLFKNGVWSE
ncbi:type 1 glutamine amidotransferase family protein [Flavilitoribacter nigricans]|uniref:Glutamine amidotransferase n=1 Tax=Flavilitoribacter nigricans (strain ATCC 23147 / DSM 23189 / NBRC 102662 / NCIMB 1420 / SS-2) TaxID=1122177 RepID=A0A2D0N9Z7_FLAN2|nr:type 1 glutamine amidotransferase family protein [Flavilitoribacter nigricans]PHN05196.1 glutamine amidotransferase [Flavilitoribacter nigricans DSM 23189 = NBRC 102662]